MSNKGRICIDIDNVVAQTDEVMRAVIRNCTAGRVNLRYDDIKDYDYWKCADAEGNSLERDEWNVVHAIFSTPRYLWAVEPVDGVARHLFALADAFDLHLATSRLPAARRTTVEWLEYHKFPTHDLHFLKHRKKHCSLGQFDAVIEDDYHQGIAFARNGTPCYLLEHPWNRAKPPVDEVQWVRDWPDLVTRLDAHAS